MLHLCSFCWKLCIVHSCVSSVLFGLRLLLFYLHLGHNQLFNFFMCMCFLVWWKVHSLLMVNYVLLDLILTIHEIVQLCLEIQWGIILLVHNFYHLMLWMHLCFWMSFLSFILLELCVMFSKLLLDANIAIFI